MLDTSADICSQISLKTTEAVGKPASGSSKVHVLWISNHIKITLLFILQKGRENNISLSKSLHLASTKVFYDLRVYLKGIHFHFVTQKNNNFSLLRYADLF